MKLLKGKKVAKNILRDVRNKIRSENLNLGLAVVLVGNDESSIIYIDLKKEAAAKVGIDFKKIEMNKNVSEKEVLEKISELNRDKEINGIIVQFPLPEHLDKLKIVKAINSQKDVDGFSTFKDRSHSGIDQSLYGARIFGGHPVFPRAIMILIESSGQKLTGKRGIIICNSEKFGKVMQFILEKYGVQSEYIFKENIQSNLEKIKNADILITAVGKPGLITGDMVKQGAIVIDGGIIRADGKVTGDIDLESVKDVAGYVSPVPGGVGPVTVACLMENVYLHTKNK